MKKKALLVLGMPLRSENVRLAKKNYEKNIFLISQILQKENYSCTFCSPEDVKSLLEEDNLLNYDLFYFTGHANNKFLGNKEKKVLLNHLFENLSEPTKTKIAILDACTLGYIQNNPIENVKTFGAYKSYSSKSLAKVLYDLVILRRIPLDSIDSSTFQKNGYYWVQFNQGNIEKYPLDITISLNNS